MLLLFFVQCLPRVSDVVPRLCNAFRGLVMLSPRLCNAFRGLVMSPRLCNAFRGLVMSSPACAMSSEGRLAPRCCAGHVTKLAVPFGPARQVTTACFYALGRHTHRRGGRRPFFCERYMHRGDDAPSSVEGIRTGGGQRPFFCGRHTHRRGTMPFLLRKAYAQARDNALSSVEGICTDRKRICTSYLVKQ